MNIPKHRHEILTVRLVLVKTDNSIKLDEAPIAAGVDES